MLSYNNYVEFNLTKKTNDKNEMNIINNYRIRKKI